MIVKYELETLEFRFRSMNGSKVKNLRYIDSERKICQQQIIIDNVNCLADSYIIVFQRLCSKYWKDTIIHDKDLLRTVVSNDKSNLGSEALDRYQLMLDSHPHHQYQIQIIITDLG